MTFRTFLGVGLCRLHRWLSAILRFTSDRLRVKALYGSENPLRGTMVQLLVRGVDSFKSTRSTNRTRVGVLGLNNQRSKVVCVLPSFLLKFSFRLGRLFLLLPPPPCLGARLGARLGSSSSNLGYLAGDQAPVSM